MQVHSILPDPSISAYVSHIVAMENTKAYGEAILPLIAKGSPSIAFQLTNKGPQQHLHPKTETLVLYGQNIRPIELYTSGQVTIVAYFLYPHVLHTLFGMPARELTDTHIDISVTEPARQLRLKEQLLNAVSLQQRLQLMNRYILRLADTRRIDTNPAISFATQLIQNSKGLVSLSSVQQELYTTERTLQRIFDLHVGLSPKQYSRICQFQAAFRQLQASRFAGAAGIAYDNGYADQSHLLRSFKSFTNHSPQEYIRLAEAFPG